MFKLYILIIDNLHSSSFENINLATVSKIEEIYNVVQLIQLYPKGLQRYSTMYIKFT